MTYNQALIKTLKEVMQLLLIPMFATNILQAQDVHSDNSNGTYTNPLISADFPDPDVIHGNHHHVRFSGSYYSKVARPGELGILQQCGAPFRLQ